MNLWLSPEILTWNMDPMNLGASQSWDILKPYDLLRHAKKRLDEVDDKENPDNENPALGEVVYHLRRAIEHREKQLADKFNLSGLPFEIPAGKKKSPIHERLHQLGIIQPVLRRKLSDLRNLITHEQKDPHTKDKSLIDELYEFTWYFLRSTDSFLGRSISGMIFYPPDDSKPDFDWFDADEHSQYEHDESYKYKGCFLIEISPKNKWQLKIKGYEVPINLFSKQEKKNWLEIVVEYFDDLSLKRDYDFIVKRARDELAGQEETEADRDVAREKRFDEYSSSSNTIEKFEGSSVGPSVVIEALIKTIFELYMYY